MDFLGNLGQSLQKGGLKAVAELLGSKFNLPSTVTSAVSGLVERVDGQQLNSLTSALQDLSSGNYTQALNNFRFLTQQLPQEGILHWFKGALELKEGQALQAQSDLKQAQQLDANLPDFSSLLNLLK
jgi:Flp pilus assembly protein TadD